MYVLAKFALTENEEIGKLNEEYLNWKQQDQLLHYYEAWE